MDLTREERETIIRISDAEDSWSILTASPKFIRKFAKLGYEVDDTTATPEEYKCFKVPLNLVSFRRQRIELSDKEIAARKKGLQRARAVR